MPKVKKQRKRPQFRRVAEGIFQSESSKAYYARFSFKGKRIYKALGTRARPCTSLPEAKRLLRDRRDEAEQTDAKIASLTLHQLVEQYRATLQGAPSTKAYKGTHLDLLKKEFPATKKVREVNTHDLRLFLQVHEGKSAATLNKAITVLRDVFEAAVEMRAIPNSPASKIRYKKEGDEVKRLTPSSEEFQAIVHHIRTQKYADTAQASGDLIEFMGLAGLGQAECAGLSWQDINFAARTIVLIRRKTRKQFTIPLYPQVLPLLERMDGERIDPQPEDKVFSVKNPKKALKDACKRLKLPDYTARALRRMFIREARRCGVSPQYVAKWQGHKDTKMIMRIYDEPTDDEGMKMAALLTPRLSAAKVPDTSTLGHPESVQDEQPAQQ